MVLKTLNLTTKKEYINDPGKTSEELIEKESENQPSVVLGDVLKDDEKDWKYYIGRIFHWIFSVLKHVLKIAWVILIILFKLAKKIISIFLAIILFGIWSSRR